jgi:excisionase family DNA binding protein
MPKKFLRPREVARLLVTSRDRVTDLIAAGELPAIDIRSAGARRATWRIDVAMLNAFLARRSSTAAEDTEVADDPRS